MRLGHIVPRIDEEASGPSYSVPRLCQSLAARGHSIELMCLAAKGEVPGVVLNVHPQWRAFNRFAISPQLAKTLHGRAGILDIVHNHSLWAMPNVVAGLLVPGRRAKLVTSPRGTLSAWALAHSKWVKRAIWPLQRRALFGADLLHATSEAELAEIRSLGLHRPVAIIPNGIDIPEINYRFRSQSRQCTLLFLSRIHPKKGIDLLLSVWQQLQDKYPDWRLVVAGIGEPKYVQSIKILATKLGLKRTEFVGPVYGVNKSELYASSELFVLPSHSENFGMAIAEALAHGVPAVVSKGAPWRGLVTEGCGWWIENTSESLSYTLDQAMAMNSQQLRENGLQGRKWMEREFSWNAVGRNMSDAYYWLLSGGEKPACVSLDR